MLPCDVQCGNSTIDSTFYGYNISFPNIEHILTFSPGRGLTAVTARTDRIVFLVVRVYVPLPSVGERND